MNAESSLDGLTAAGLAGNDVAAWARSNPRATGGFAEDREAFAGYWRAADLLVARLPKKPRRSPVEEAAAETIKQQARAARIALVSSH